jgi:NADH-quinone oxidoreductase subunit L
LFSYGVASSLSIYVTLFPWFELGLFSVNWCFCLDSISMVMSVVVLGVSALVHTYSCGYMEGDPHIPIFIYFTNNMLI